MKAYFELGVLVALIHSINSGLYRTSIITLLSFDLQQHLYWYNDIPRAFFNRSF